MRALLITWLLLVPLQSVADVYYASFKDAGEVSASGNDLVLYFDNYEVWGELRIFSNMYDNVTVTLYGKGTDGDIRLFLEAIASSEGNTYEVSDFTLDFQGESNQKVMIESPMLAKTLVLQKKSSVINEMKFLGPLQSKSKIIKLINRFSNKIKSKVAASVLEKLPNANLGNTRRVSLYNQDFHPLNLSLQQLFESASRQPDSAVFKRFKADPAFAVIYGFKKTGLLPDAKQVYAYTDKPGKVGYTWKTCPADFNIEDDEQGLCQTFHFYHDKHLDISPVIVEVETHKTCLDDSCFHDYYQFHLRKGITFGWKVTSKLQGVRCDANRGGGSPPCL